jgi:hypothetical protein
MTHYLSKILLIILFLACITSQYTFAQTYHFPVNPGQKCYLTGSVGEIRAGHFHAGLDIACPTGTKVYAAADGYIRRVKASTWGYGNVLYVMHPSTNEQTVYAHLNDFNDKITVYVTQKQYEQKIFDIELLPEPNVLPVKKGEVIGFTGNTGQSGGPHLHYEIRTPDDVALNPMQYGFKELPQDNIPPIIQKIALESLGIDSRVESQFMRQEYPVRKVGNGTYTIDRVIPVYGLIGLEILTHDLVNGGYNVLGTTEIKISLDGKEVYTHDFNHVSHEYNRCMNIHVNYPIFRQSYQGFQRCYYNDGNKFDNYQSQRHTFNIRDGETHTVTLKALDPAGNQSTLTLKLLGKAPNKARFLADKSFLKPSMKHHISENILVLKAQNIKQNGDFLPLSFNGVVKEIPLAYQLGSTYVYLWDLREGLPDMVESDDLRYTFQFDLIIPSEQDITYHGKDFRIRFPVGALFDTLYLEVNKSDNFIEINNADIPVFGEIEVYFDVFKPTGKASQWAAYYNGTSHQRSEMTDSTLVFYTKNLGKFYLKRDVSPPQMSILVANYQQIQVRISDTFSGIKEHSASLNGKFLLLRYEHKAGLLFWKPTEERKILKGELQIEVEDYAGNQQIIKKTL